MGLGLFYSSSIHEDTNKIIKKGEPDPSKFNILKTTRIGIFLVAKIHYSNCNNYEGNKVLVFKNVYDSDLNKLNILDPHFTNKKSVISPIARFTPTKKGYDMAVNFCKFQWSTIIKNRNERKNKKSKIK